MNRNNNGPATTGDRNAKCHQVPLLLGYPFQPIVMNTQNINPMFTQHGLHQFHHSGLQLRQPFLFNQHLQQPLIQIPIPSGNIPHQHYNVVPNIHFDQYLLQQQRSLQAKMEEEQQNQKRHLISQHNLQVLNVNRNVKPNWHIESTTKIGKPPPLMRNPDLPVHNVIQRMQISDPQQFYRSFLPDRQNYQELVSQSHNSQDCQDSIKQINNLRNYQEKNYYREELVNPFDNSVTRPNSCQ